ncbi:MULTISPECIES: WXG100 family type VII secretion target [Actinomadura]|uniref:WXG100 family type VII secretion target n=1 Tax=Actinomadura yumaensis TaxID=111807 RepID=A0ABW2CI23_9ACTN|nr:hypothetical protein [Actinomadura sp. J1-007]MWK34532.1 hypothetical protein [Actinomadura sp. J1-007]
MTAFNSYNTMMGTATVEADLARLVLPPALMVGMQFKLCKGNPTNLEKASKAWGDAARAIEDTAEQMQASVASISADDWTAEDRQAYERKVQEFLQQLQVMHTFCQAVQIALIAYAWALMVYATFAVVMGTFLAALAAAATAAAMGVITAGIAATCEAIAATCLSVTIVATSALGMAAQMAAVVFQGGALTAALAEKAKGNDAALADFMKAEEVGAAAAGANLAQNAVNGGLTFAGTPGMRRGGGFPVSDVDLDADRNGNRTWNVGGGATVNAGGFTTTGGGHVKYGDHGFAGGDVSGNVKHNASGFSAGGNAEYTDEDGIGRGNAGNVKYGANLAYQTPGSVPFNNPALPPSATPGGTNDSVGIPNAGAKFGFEGKHDFENGQGSRTTYGSGQINGGDVYKNAHTTNYDGTGATGYTRQVETPGGTDEDRTKRDETPPWDR